MATHYLTTPLGNDALDSLRVGDTVYISGTVYTARDAGHKRLVKLLEQNAPLPFDPRGAVIYYMGPTPAPPGKPIGAAGPTSSYRMDAYAPVLLNAGVKVMIGKGPRNCAVVESMLQNRAVYLAAVGGAAVVIAQSIMEARVIAWEDLGAEAVRELKVENFPCVVANDLHGGDIYTEGVARYRIIKE